ncbi:MAG: hypothetical protein IKA02_00605 [Clostridia bacterium]|nr:hypothetical protein [Clostridia bacterium]
MKSLVKILAAILIVIFTIGMVGCKTLSDEEAKGIFNTLVKESYELNVIYFGDGLKPQVTEEDSLYIPVQGSENYTAKLPLVERTREIFSTDYASDIIKTAFEGEMGVVGSSAIYARYIEYEGYLSVRRDIDGIEVAKYDYSTTEIIKVSNRFIIAKIKTVNLEKNEYVEITLINEDNGWRIDSATY